MCVSLQTAEDYVIVLILGRWGECFVVVGTCVDVCIGQLRGIKLIQINLLHCVKGSCVYILEGQRRGCWWSYEILYCRWM
jgi:hypothetical protein